MTVQMSYESCYLTVDSLEALREYYNFSKPHHIFENDLHIVNNPTDINHRKKMDASVLSLIAANAPAGRMLDIGTHFGRSAARMAVNSPNSIVYTVNVHPNQAQDAGLLVTDILPEEEIGKFYRQHNIPNIRQIYANTKYWDIPPEISDLSVVYVDGCHDTEFVISDTKLVYDRVRSGGFILWHDFSPIYRKNFNWIDAAMNGVEQLIAEGVVKGFVLNVRNSWIGIWQKQ